LTTAAYTINIFMFVIIYNCCICQFLQTPPESNVFE